jgi:hypothetical protein
MMTRHQIIDRGRGPELAGESSFAKGVGTQLSLRNYQILNRLRRALELVCHHFTQRRALARSQRNLEILRKRISP